MFEIFEMEMPELGKTRNIRVWLPEAYQERPEQRFPVMYMHDAQNLFNVKDAAYGMIWDAHTAVQGLIDVLNPIESQNPVESQRSSDARSGFSGCIIVGIDNAPGLDRLNEYSPWASLAAKALKDLESVEGDIGGEGEAYGRFIINTLKPFIDQRYRTLSSREHTSVVGSSMGGFISLYLGSEYPEVFSKIGAFSTAIWFEEEKLLKQLEKVNPVLDTRWYLDVGTEETSNDSIEDFNTRYINGSKNAVEKLKACGIPETHIRLVVDEGAIHNELAWANRLPAALKWLFELNL
jgi:predicted alpha/beta superfamily hydrolase